MVCSAKSKYRLDFKKKKKKSNHALLTAREGYLQSKHIILWKHVLLYKQYIKSYFDYKKKKRLFGEKCNVMQVGKPRILQSYMRCWIIFASKVIQYTSILVFNN